MNKLLKNKMDSEKLNELMHRVSYLAKRETKQYGSGHHNFGTGRKKISQ